MADFIWPDDLVPFDMDFSIDPHTGGSESPFSRVGKYYGLSKPRWVCTMSFRGGHWGTRGLEAVGRRIDAMLDKLDGRLKTVEIYDFRNPGPSGPFWPSAASNLAAVLGATTMTITGLQPGAKVYERDYIGGDGRPHRILETVAADSSGQAVVTFKPALDAAIGAGAATFHKVAGTFRRTGDSGFNPQRAGQPVEITLEFVEAL